MEAIEYPMDTCQFLFCYIDSTNSMLSLSGKARIGLYVDAHHCTSCWENGLNLLSKWNDSLFFENTPIVLANNFNMREIRIMQENTELPIYSLGNTTNFLSPLTKFNSPFFFVIENSIISRPYFPSKQIGSSLHLKYLTHIKAVLKSKNKNINSLRNNSLTLLNSIVDLGMVETREKRTIQYKLHNNMNEPCFIFRCMPSCSCVVVDSFSTAIPAGGDGYVAISTIQLNKGEFNHSINIQTNIQSQPYSVSFSGFCE